MEAIKPTGTVDHSRKALLCMGKARAEVRGRRDGGVRGSKGWEGKVIVVVSEGSEGSVYSTMGCAQPNSKRERGGGRIHACKDVTKVCRECCLGQAMTIGEGTPSCCSFKLDNSSEPNSSSLEWQVQSSKNKRF